MAVKYHIVARPDPQNPDAPPKYYPSVKNQGRVSLRELSQRISEISTVSSSDVLAVLEALLLVIPQFLGEGKLVQLGDLGSISLRIRSRGVEQPKNVNHHQITSILPHFMPGKWFKAALSQVEFTKES